MKSSRSKFGSRPTHEVPLWVHPDDHVFHIRIRQNREDPIPLTAANRAVRLLDSAEFYDRRRTWGVTLFLLMPDHLHALLYLPPERNLGTIIGSWKAYHAQNNGLDWQKNFFDHRIRNEQSEGEQWAYIRRNPVAAGLCEGIDDWPWWIAQDDKGELIRGY